jgi:hypothetical protein
METICYAVKDWDKHFENSESRKIKSLTWLPVKNKHDGKGYRRVVAHPKSIQVFCAWNLMIQVASKMPVRGVLRDEDGPITTSDLSFKTGYPEHIFEEAFKVLSDNKVGWLVPVKCDKNPAVLGNSPSVSVDVGIEGNGREQNGITPPPVAGPEFVGGGEEIPTLEQAVAQTATAGIPPEFATMVYETWVKYGGKNGAGVRLPFLTQVTSRWKNEQNEWKNGTHTHQRKHDKHRKSSQPGVDRNAGGFNANAPTAGLQSKVR